MRKLGYIMADIVKCLLIGIITSLAIAFIVGLFGFIIHKGNSNQIFELIKRFLYYIGMLGLLLSCGFFVQRDATRPLIYNDEWKKYFKQLHLGFVIMFINLSLCLIGMIIQILIEAGKL